MLSRTSFHEAYGAQHSIGPISLAKECSLDDTPLNINHSPVDFSVAEMPLAINRFYHVRLTEENQKIKYAIAQALMSLGCDPTVKRRIFENVMNVEKNHQHDSGKHDGASVDLDYIAAINAILDEIRESGQRIILDYTDFTEVNLKNLDMTSASAKSAKFASMRMDNVIWKNGDFTRACFDNARIRDCYFDESLFVTAVFSQCYFESGIVNKVTVRETRFYDTNFADVFVLSLKTDDVQLRNKIGRGERRGLATIVSTLTPGSVPRIDFEKRLKSLALESPKNAFAQIANFKHTSSHSETGSVLNLRTSLAVREAVPTFPVCIAEMIGQYASEDSRWAQQPLQTDFFDVIENERNQIIKSAIKSVLISRKCNSKIKMSIFRNMADFSKQLCEIVTDPANLSEREKLGENSYVRAIDEILAEIREDKNQIILDKVDFTGLNLRCLDLSGASAVSAIFNSMEISDVFWTGGDFSKSQFNNVNIVRCRFKKSIFDKSYQSKTYFRHSELTDTQMDGVEFQRTKFDGVFADRLKTDDPVFKKIIARHRISIHSLRQTYLGTNVLEKSPLVRLIFQYAKKESAAAVYFLACEFSTQKHAPPKSRNFRFWSWR